MAVRAKSEPISALSSQGLRTKNGALIGALTGAVASLIGLVAEILYVTVYERNIHFFVETHTMNMLVLWILFLTVAVTIIAGIVSGIFGLRIAGKHKRRFLGGILSGAEGGALGAVAGGIVIVLVFMLRFSYSLFIFESILTLLFITVIGFLIGMISGLLIAAFGVLIGGALPMIFTGFWAIFSFHISPLNAVRVPTYIYLGISLIGAVPFLLLVLRSSLSKEAQHGALGAAIGGICGAVTSFQLVSMVFTI